MTTSIPLRIFLLPHSPGNRREQQERTGYSIRALRPLDALCRQDFPSAAFRDGRTISSPAISQPSKNCFSLAAKRQLKSHCQKSQGDIGGTTASPASIRIRRPFRKGRLLMLLAKSIPCSFVRPLVVRSCFLKKETSPLFDALPSAAERQLEYYSTFYFRHASTELKFMKIPMN